VFTDIGVFDFNGKDRRMRTVSLHPGVTKEEVLAKTGFAVEFSGEVRETRVPEDEELRLIREDIDPENLLLRY
jgi:acyl CoA:acetate/3-ketoacid CoA transferase beta subunit